MIIVDISHLHVCRYVLSKTNAFMFIYKMVYIHVIHIVIAMWYPMEIIFYYIDIDIIHIQYCLVGTVYAIIN